MRCVDCQNRLLDLLYGLLDPAEEAAVLSHLADCTSCATARTEAERSQGLFARAAKFPFPEAVFVRPSDDAQDVTVPASTQNYRQIRTLFPWVIAAGLLLAIGIPVLTDLVRLQRSQANAERTYAALLTVQEQRNANLQRAQEREQSAKQAILVQGRKWIEAETPKASQKPLKLEVTGPSAAVPGAPNEYLLRARDPAGKIVVSSFEAALVDKAGVRVAMLPTVNAIGGESIGANIRPVSLRIPADVWSRVPLTTRDVYLSVTAINPTTKERVSLDEPIPVTLPVFTTFLVTDKPMYQPGETLYFRSVTLDRTKLLPPSTDPILKMELRKPDGTVVPDLQVSGRTRLLTSGHQPVLGPDGKPLRGVTSGAFTLPAQLPGGEYMLVALEEDPSPRNPGGRPAPPPQPVASRKILINNYTPDQLQKSLDFDRRSYGPGDTITATIKVQDQAKPVAGAQIESSLVGTGVFVLGEPKSTDADGKVILSFALPNKPDLANVTLSLVITHKAIKESLVRKVPLTSQKLTLEFYPEGGDLVEGLPGRVYFRVLDDQGKPADAAGYVTDGSRTVAEARTLTDAENPGVNQGMGVFTFTPEKGKRYAFKLKQPSNAIEPTLTQAISNTVKTGFALPAARTEGIVLTMPQGVIRPDEPIRATLQSTQKRKLLVGAYIRGSAVGHQEIAVEPGTPATITITPPADAVGGVTRVTVFEQLPTGPKALAERLIFRRPPEQLNLAFTTGTNRFQPGEKVTLNVMATNEKQAPTPAVLWVAVVNQSVLSMADDRTERGMPAHFLLAGELQKPEQFEFADFFLTDQPKAAESLDLLLGTQGWRRFAEQSTPQRTHQPQQLAKPDVRDFLTRLGAAPPVSTPDAVAAEYLPKLESLKTDLEDATRNLQLAKVQQRIATPESQAYETAQREAKQIENQLYDPQRWVRSILILAGFAFVGLVFYFRNRYLKCAVAFFAFCSLGIMLLPFIGCGDTRKFAFVGADARNFPPTAGAPPKSAAKWTPEDPVAPMAMRAKDDIRESMNARRSSMILDLKARKPADLRRSPMPTAANSLKVAVPEAITSRALATLLEEEFRSSRENQRLTPLEVEGLNRVKNAVLADGPFQIREYAHHHPTPVNSDATRTDFAETVLWQPVLVVPDSGQASLSFDLGDSLNAYRVLVAGHTLDGRLGSASGLIEVRKPLTVEFKLPAEMTTGDKLKLPVSINNASGLGADVSLGFWSDHLRSTVDGEQRITVAPNDGARVSIPLQASNTGVARVRLSANGPGGRNDAVERPIRIVPSGFPATAAVSDLLENGTTVKMIVPKDLQPNTLTANVTVYTNTLGSIASGMEGMLREPHGCFEQTSSSNYPNLLVLDYLQKSGNVNEEFAKRAHETLDRGLNRLMGFEVHNRFNKVREGFEWFGQYPPHQALTAYGLVQFADMTRVHHVDPKMIERTQKYLIGQRDGNDGFQRKADGHTFGSAAPSISNAYILWALTESNPNLDLTREMAAATQEALRSGDPYRLALVALSLQNCGDKATAVLKKLESLQVDDGSVPGAETSITRSMGQDLLVETTALAALAFQKGARPNPYEVKARNAIRFLVSRRQGQGTFGATQATVLALKALVEFARQNPQTDSEGEISVFVGNTLIGKKAYRSSDPDPVTIAFENPEKIFASGAVDVRIQTTAKATYPFTASWSAMVQTPDSEDDCPVKLSTALDQTRIEEGKSVRLRVTMANRQDREQGMAVAVIGLPAGLTLPPDFKQFESLTLPPKDGDPVLSHWELIGRQLVLYWRGMAPKQTRDLTIDLVASFPGEFTGPASRAYLYYSPSSKMWLKPLQIQITD